MRDSQNLYHLEKISVSGDGIHSFCSEDTESIKMKIEIASDFIGREYEVDYRQPPSMHLYSIEVQGPQI